MGTLYFLLGLALAALAVGALAGPWWGVLVLGVELVALGILTETAGLLLHRPSKLENGS